MKITAYRHILTAATACAVAAGLAACGSSSSGSSGTDNGKPRSGGNLAIVITGYNWNGLDPAGSPVTSVKGLINAIYDPLFRLDSNGKVTPWLATGYTVSANRHTWTFKLRQGVRFTDGTPFNSAAVKFNLLRQIDPNQHAGEAGGNLPKKLTIDTPDDGTVVVRLTEPDEALLYGLATSAVGLMASPAAVRKWGSQFGLHPVGTGPFKLKDEVVGQSATLTKNDKYWVPGEPYLNSVTYRVLGSEESALQTLNSGGAQMMDFIAPLQAKEATAADNLALVKGKATTTDQMIFNTTKPPFNDVRARRAVGYAIDQESLSKNLFYGFDTPVQSDIASGSWAYPGDVVPNYPAFDMAKAKALVAQLGGLSFELKVSNSADTLARATAVQNQLAAAGIKMQVTPQDDSRSVADLFSRNYQAKLMIVPGLPDPDGYVRQFFDSAAGANPSGVNDPRLASLFAKGRTTPGEAARKKIYAQVAARMAELSPTVYLSQNPPMKLLRKNVHGVKILPIDAFYLDAAWLG